MKTTEIKLTATFTNKQKYVYYGQTKKECKEQLLKKFGNSKGFTLEYTTEDI